MRIGAGEACRMERGEVAYLWVTEKAADKWRVSDWNCEPYWVPIDGFYVKADRELSDTTQKAPVIRIIGTGDRAQYYRFEKLK